MSTGQCVIQDDFGPLKQKLLAAHGLILGSPTYALAPNARMKVFLERMGTFWVYSSLLSDKYIVGLSTAGGMGARSVARSLTGLVNGFFGSGKISGTLGVLVGDGDVPPEALARAETLGRRLVADIASQRRYRLQQPVARVIRWVAASAMARPNVLKGRDDRMKAVYEVLVARGRVRRRM